MLHSACSGSGSWRLHCEQCCNTVRLPVLDPAQLLCIETTTHTVPTAGNMGMMSDV